MDDAKTAQHTNVTHNSQVVDRLTRNLVRLTDRFDEPQTLFFDASSRPSFNYKQVDREAQSIIKNALTTISAYDANKVNVPIRYRNTSLEICHKIENFCIEQATSTNTSHLPTELYSQFYKFFSKDIRTRFNNIVSHGENVYH